MKSKKKSGFKKFIAAIAILSFIIVALSGVDFYLKIFTPYFGNEAGITITIPRGATIEAIAHILHKEKIISSYYYFRIYYRLFFSKTSFKSGEYFFDKPLTMREVITKLNEGKVVMYKITIKEGLSIPEIADIVAAQPSLKLSANDFIKETRSASFLSRIRSLDSKADDLEGYLFPDTYLVRRDVTVSELVKMMLDRFKENFSQALAWRAHEMNLSIRETLTLASLIEKETASREERFLISSVFHNRLRLGMLLDCDPTVIYALRKENIYTGKLRWVDLKYDSPYNTRVHRGLPPGPICNPGIASIEAALNPETTNYLYFVAQNPQSHYFSETLDEHNRAVHKFIINHENN